MLDKCERPTTDDLHTFCTNFIPQPAYEDAQCPLPQLRALRKPHRSLLSIENFSVIRSSPNEATPHFDLEHGSENVVQTFLDGEISFKPGAAESENILQLATKERHTAIVRLLRETDTRTSHATSDDERYLEKAFQPLGAGDTVRRIRQPIGTLFSGSTILGTQPSNVDNTNDIGRSSTLPYGESQRSWIVPTRQDSCWDEYHFRHCSILVTAFASQVRS